VYHLRIGIAGALTLILAVTIFVVVHIGLGVHTVQDLDVAHFQALFSGLLEKMIETASQLLPAILLEEAILVPRMGHLNTLRVL
jgi:hypothetical protein